MGAVKAGGLSCLGLILYWEKWITHGRGDSKGNLMSFKLYLALAVLVSSVGIGAGTAFVVNSETGKAACCGTDKRPDGSEQCCSNWCPECEECPAICLDCGPGECCGAVDASAAAATAKTSCCLEGECSEPKSVAASAKVKKAACCPDGPCCRDGPCCK